MLSHVFGAVDKTSCSFSAHGKIGNFIIIRHHQFDQGKRTKSLYHIDLFVGYGTLPGEVRLEVDPNV